MLEMGDIFGLNPVMYAVLVWTSLAGTYGLRPGSVIDTTPPLSAGFCDTKYAFDNNLDTCTTSSEASVRRLGGQLSQTAIVARIEFNISFGGQEYCPDGWYTLEGYCYKVMTDKLSWYGARTRCNEVGGSLSPLTGQLFGQLMHLVNRSVSVDAWTGVTLHGQPSGLDSNSAIIDTLWHTTDVDAIPYSCVYLHTGGSCGAAIQWRYDSCDDKHIFACQYPLAVADTEEEYMYAVDNLAYNISSRLMTWYAAQDACPDVYGSGAQLPLITSTQQQALLIRIMNERDLNDVWVGLVVHTVSSGNVWRMAYSVEDAISPADENYLYSALAAGLPDITQDTDVCVLANEMEWKMEVADCLTTKSYLCRTPMQLELASGDVHSIDVYVGMPAFPVTAAGSLGFCDHIPGFTLSHLVSKTARCYMPTYADYIYIQVHIPTDSRVRICEVFVTVADEHDQFRRFDSFPSRRVLGAGALDMEARMACRPSYCAYVCAATEGCMGYNSKGNPGCECALITGESNLNAEPVEDDDWTLWKLTVY